MDMVKFDGFNGKNLVSSINFVQDIAGLELYMHPAIQLLESKGLIRVRVESTKEGQQVVFEGFDSRALHCLTREIDTLQHDLDQAMTNLKSMQKQYDQLVCHASTYFDADPYEQH